MSLRLIICILLLACLRKLSIAIKYHSSIFRGGNSHSQYRLSLRSSYRALTYKAVFRSICLRAHCDILLAIISFNPYSMQSHHPMRNTTSNTILPSKCFCSLLLAKWRSHILFKWCFSSPFHLLLNICCNSFVVSAEHFKFMVELVNCTYSTISIRSHTPVLRSSRMVLTILFRLSEQHLIWQGFFILESNLSDIPVFFGDRIHCL